MVLRFTLFAWAAALAVVPAASFQLRPPAAQRLAWKRAVAVTPSGGLDNVEHYSTTSPSSSRLNMGVMEDFLSGADSSKREADNKKYLEALQKRVEAINALEPEIEELGDGELQAKTAEFQQRLEAGEDINGPLLEEAFAVVREAAWCV